MAEQLKVILWCCPRTVSTAFLKCMSSALPDSQMIFEIYNVPLLQFPDHETKFIHEPKFSEEELEESRKNPGCGFSSSIANLAWVKDILENGFKDKKLVFSKEMPCLQPDKFHYLPQEGFRHAFLIRHPVKVFKSWKKFTFDYIKKNVKDPRVQAMTMEEFQFDKMVPPQIMGPGKGFKELYDLYNHIKEQGLDPDPVILDSDDILKDPAATISAFCKKVGIPYSDSMLTWEPGAEVVQKWTASAKAKQFLEREDGFKNFRQSTCFKRQDTQDAPRVSPDMTHDLSPDIQNLVDFCMPYYEKMHQLRLLTV